MVLVGLCEPPRGLHESSVRDAVDEQREQLGECATEDAQLDVRIHIRPDGRVADVRARGSARVGPCVERLIETWRFASADGETQVELPIELAER